MMCSPGVWPGCRVKMTDQSQPQSQSLADKSALATAGRFLLLSALLHLAAPIPAGFAADALALIPIGIVYALLGFGLIRGLGWLGCVTFVLLTVAMLAAYATMGGSSVPEWWTWLILAADFAAWIFLFGHIWSR